MSNDFLRANGAETFLPKTIPANIRWGVGTSVALELMVKGIQSRTLASNISDVWKSEKRDENIRSWIRSMNLAEWRQIFDASAAELRNLLEFSRDYRGCVAVELITQEFAELEVDSTVHELSKSNALLTPISDVELSPIGIWVSGQLVGHILSRDQADIQSLQNTGLIRSVRFSASSGKGVLQLRLVNPDA